MKNPTYKLHGFTAIPLAMWAALLNVPYTTLASAYNRLDGVEMAEHIRRKAVQQFAARRKAEEEATENLRRGKCPHCGATTTAIFRDRSDPGNLQTMRCPACADMVGTYAAVEANIFPAL